ncbi:glycosyltransferase family 4 protein [Danxiaibacter flavus]|uniref:Glycosyltransferase family 4 protein n=1 Tax=Danxiaibacter flavus TaxID=3049108 RepID=A0ABV3ZJ82_9BACT|nr:glycosyltransferase family 4 protein [Chitinophagaceae bacterium DXS]
MKLIISHPTGNANVRAATLGFAKAALLFKYYTTIATFPDSWLSALANIPLFKEAKRRELDAVLRPFTSLWPWREIGRLAASKAQLTKLNACEKSFFSIDAVYRNLDKHVASKLSGCSRKDVKAVYAYEDGAANIFLEAKHLNLQCLYDLPIGYWRTARKLMAGEEERWPGWFNTITGFSDSPEKLNKKDRELTKADHIFVASSFTAGTLRDFPGTLAPVHVIPYGFPPVVTDRVRVNKNTYQPLKILFVGSLSQRKGIADLFHVVDQLKQHVQLTVVGQKVTNDCEPLNKALDACQWIPALAHNHILQLMREHDVLVFPSLFEGFGLVITEAMSQGTPVITTNRTAGPDLIQHGENGWLFEAGHTNALRENIEYILEHPSSLKRTGEAALQTAAKRPWEQYSTELADAVKQCIA